MSRRTLILASAVLGLPLTVIPKPPKVLPLAEANEALRRLRAGELTGAAVLMPEHAAR